MERNQQSSIENLYYSTPYLLGHFLALCSNEPQMLHLGGVRFRAVGMIGSVVAWMGTSTFSTSFP